MAETPDYAAPAIDKALDILELMAESTSPLSQLDIAKAVGRTSGQIFRVLSRLERRGYLYRDAQSGLYELSMKLFSLAHRHEPLRGLVAAALPAMRDLSEALRQSCNLGILDADRIRIVAQVESPAEFGFHVRVGSLFRINEAPTGKVLAAFIPSLVTEGLDPAQLEAIREAGHYVEPDTAQPGITDVIHPVLNRTTGEAVAALTVPYVSTSYSGVTLEEVQRLAAETASRIADSLGVASETEGPESAGD